jgi:hypothetical protein
MSVSGISAESILTICRPQGVRLIALTRSEFRNHALALPVTINGTAHTAVVKEFSTGSLGWNINGKTEITVNGKPVKVQIGLNLTIVGSKDMPEGAAETLVAAAAAA